MNDTNTKTEMDGFHFVLCPQCNKIYAIMDKNSSYTTDNRMTHCKDISFNVKFIIMACKKHDSFAIRSKVYPVDTVSFIAKILGFNCIDYIAQNAAELQHLVDIRSINAATDSPMAHQSKTAREMFWVVEPYDIEPLVGFKGECMDDIF